MANSLRMSLVGRCEDSCLGKNWDPLEIQAQGWRAHVSWGMQGPCTQELQTPPFPSSALAHHTCPTLASPFFPNPRNARLLPTVVLLISVRSWDLSWWHLTGRLPHPNSPVLLTPFLGSSFISLCHRHFFSVYSCLTPSHCPCGL